MKTYGNRAIELLKLIQEVLEAGAEKEVEETTPDVKTSDVGKSQPVHGYPDSPLRYGGMGR